MDPTDRKIIAELAADSRLPTSILARRLGIARSTLQSRIVRLEKSGIIKGYSLRLGEDAREGRIVATVLVQIEPKMNASVLSRLRAITDVEVAHTTSGRFDLILQVASASTAELDVLLDRIGMIDGVKSSESLIHLTTKFDRAL